MSNKQYLVIAILASILFGLLALVFILNNLTGKERVFKAPQRPVLSVFDQYRREQKVKHKLQERRVNELLQALEKKNQGRERVSEETATVRYYNEEVITSYNAGRKPRSRKEWQDESKIVIVSDYETKVQSYLEQCRSWLKEHPESELPEELRSFSYNPDWERVQAWNDSISTSGFHDPSSFKHSFKPSQGTSESDNKGVEGTSENGSGDRPIEEPGPDEGNSI